MKITLYLQSMKQQASNFFKSSSPIVREIALPVLLGASTYPLWYRIFRSHMPLGTPVPQLWPAAGSTFVATCTHMALKRLSSRQDNPVPPSAQNLLNVAKPAEEVFDPSTFDFDTSTTDKIITYHHVRDFEKTYQVLDFGAYSNVLKEQQQKVEQVLNLASQYLQKNKEAILQNPHIGWWAEAMYDIINDLNAKLKENISSVEINASKGKRISYHEHASLVIANNTRLFVNNYLKIISDPSQATVENISAFCLSRIRTLLIQTDILNGHEKTTFATSPLKTLPFQQLKPESPVCFVQINETLMINLTLEDVLKKSYLEVSKTLKLVVDDNK